MCRQCTVWHWTLITRRTDVSTARIRLHLHNTSYRRSWRVPCCHAVTLSRCHAVTLPGAPCGCVTHLDHVGVSSVRCRLLQAGDIGLWPPLPRPTPGPGAGERRHQTLHPGKLEYPRRLLKADVILCCQTKWSESKDQNRIKKRCTNLWPLDTHNSKKCPI